MHTVFLSPPITGHAAGHPSVWLERRLHEEACQWLNEDVVPRSPSPNTWAQAARAVVTWLDYCLAAGIDWRMVTRDDLVAYRDAYLNAISPITGRPYSANTVRTRMTYIIDFIGFANEMGWCENDAIGVMPSHASASMIRRPLDRDALAHTRKGQAVSTSSMTRKLLPKATQDDTIRVLRREELSALLQWTGPRPSERSADCDTGCDRDRIVLDLGWAAGLRVDEIRTLKIFPFESVVPNSAFPGELFKFSITGKGRKTRQVDIPAWLVIDMQAYIAGERRRSLARRGKKAYESWLILNSEHSRSRAGYPMTISGLDALMARACEGAGLMRKLERRNPETGEVAINLKPRFSLHCLRHTYAVMIYHALKSSCIDDFERWKYIQIQLGHVSPMTTMDIYLKHVTVWSDVRVSSMSLEMLGI